MQSHAHTLEIRDLVESPSGDALYGAPFFWPLIIFPIWLRSEIRSWGSLVVGIFHLGVRGSRTNLLLRRTCATQAAYVRTYKGRDVERLSCRKQVDV